jgi:hypothetical protein
MSSSPPSVADALRLAEERQHQQRERHASFRREIEQEIARIEHNIENLQVQLATLHEARAVADRPVDDRPSSEAAFGVISALKAQGGALATRNSEWLRADAEVKERWLEAIQGPEVAALIAEVEQFAREVEPTLPSLPPSYRDALLAHHRGVREQLADRLVELERSPQLEAETLEIEVVVAGDGMILMVLTPIAEEVFSDWMRRPADLLTRVASRVVRGLYDALLAADLDTTEVAFGGHEGLLAMEIEISGGTGVLPAVQASIERALAEAPDLVQAKVVARLVELPVEALLPADEEDVHD